MEVPIPTSRAVLQAGRRLAVCLVAWGTCAIFCWGAEPTGGTPLAPAAEFLPPPLPDAQQLDDFTPWWNDPALAPVEGGDRVVHLGLEELVRALLVYSPRIQAVRELPRIEETRIAEAAADFDVYAFLENTFDDTSDPVGNELTTGGPSRLNEHTWRSNGGLRRKNTYGGDFEITQDWGFQNSNSLFFVPNDQGTAKLTLRYIQPLLQGRGQAYNCSSILLAKVDQGVAWSQFGEQLQSQILSVIEAYWDAYLQRAVLLQRRQSYQRAAGILVLLEQRQGFDTVASQLAQARAEVAARRMGIIRGARNVRNTQIELYRLVQDPRLEAARTSEFIPADGPSRQRVSLELKTALVTALAHRPEVRRDMQRVRAASVRQRIARHELMPQLDLVVSTYVSGLAGDTELGQAWSRQFDDGAPSYSGGLVLEVPLGNRAALARLRRSSAERSRLTAELRATLADVRAEVAVAVGEVETAYESMQNSLVALQAAGVELQYNRRRWELGVGDGRAGSTLLDELLQSQQRLALREAEFVASEVAYVVRQAQLRFAEGSLLEYEQVQGASLPPPDSQLP